LTAMAAALIQDSIRNVLRIYGRATVPALLARTSD
jgi:hypothetical protein